MKNWCIALGFYQNPRTAQSVFKKLKTHGFRHCASIHHTHDDQINIKTNRPFDILAGCGIGLLILLIFLFLSFDSPSAHLIALMSIAFAGLITWLGIIKFYAISSKIVDQFKDKIIRDETLIIVQVPPSKVQEALMLLRQVESGHPVSFLLRPDLFKATEQETDLLKEPLTLDHLSENAKHVADSLKHVTLKLDRDQTLLRRLKKDAQILDQIRKDVVEAEQIEQNITVSAEWLIDNTHVIQGTIEEIQRNLPRKYYDELPKLVEGPLAGFPRIYAIAKELIQNTANRLNRENIITFLNSYQSIDPLTIGELWALPLMLRLRLIECIQVIALQIDRRLREGELASIWGNRLLHAARREPERLSAFLSDLEEEVSIPSSHFAEELIDHLFDEETVLPLVKKWLEEKFSINISEVIQREQRHKITDEAALSSAIISLINLTQLSWREVFEIISPIDALLSQDPVGIYAAMDFATRDSYRLSIERLARHSDKSEVEVAHIILHLANQGQDDVTRHVGYYLIDNGLYQVEKNLSYRPSIPQRICRALTFHPLSFYFGSIALLIVLIELALLHISIKWPVSLSQMLLFTFLSLLPVSDIAIQFINFLFTKILPPLTLPKMSFETHIPEKYKTLVVVPMLLSSKEEIEENLNNLEVHYLANPDSIIRFGLFCDFLDAKVQHREDDALLLDVAIKGIENLAAKYGQGKFFLFHRQRVWSESEQSWIGWERKRGKLEYLNLFLTGKEESLPENILKVGPKEALHDIHYVITLDADTQMPKGKAKEMIATIAHPLNVACLSPEGIVKRGYTIIQPRVTSSFLRGNLTLFSHLFSDVTGIDPYTHVISDIYQDLMQEGTYHGKGIYDVNAFSTLLSGRFPDSHLLSHDLLEGAHVRVGFASDISLFDSFPQDYFSWSKRQHRWMRGDWQIIDWLFSRVPANSSQKRENLLSLIDRWKIFDNLRRALLPAFILLLLVIGWLVSPVPWLWTVLALVTFFLPSILMLFSGLIASPRMTLLTWRMQGRDLLRVLVMIAVLPHQAYMSLHAFLTVLYRRLFTHHYLLEWSTLNHASKSLKRHLLKLGWVSLFALAIAVSVFFFHPLALFYALPFCILWALSPLITYGLDKTILRDLKAKLTHEDLKFLRQMARKTWRFFDDFVGPHSHWLPPDNYQAALGIEVAQRTSPTNIGLWMLSVISAYDLKFITCDSALDRLQSTFESLKKLERYEGHLLNWYDIQSLKVLYPRYVSTVDSGNLLGCLWTLEQAIYQMLHSPLLSQSILEGIVITFELFENERKDKDNNQSLRPLKNVIYNLHSDLPMLLKRIPAALDLLQSTPPDEGNKEETYWWKQLEQQLRAWDTLIHRYFSWMEILQEIPHDQLKVMGEESFQRREKILHWNPSLHDLAAGHVIEEINFFTDILQKRTDLPPGVTDSLNKLKEAVQTAEWLAGEKVGIAQEIVNEIHFNVETTNMSFLYNPDRKLFTIGFHVDDLKLDSSHYDLLASEARIASLVAIAKGDVPLVHWWALGRPYGYVYGRQVLMSWGGTMFEYLMPLLFNKYYPESLLGDACKEAVACQMIYGNLRGIPWGISEAAYSEIDGRKTYQYRSFGVPGLGFKRGLEEDLVISPYSTALALAIDPKKALKNLKMLKGNPLTLYSEYGYYESIDFTRQSDVHGMRGVIVYAYMAHHQGMSLVAINNVLNNNIMPSRFHSDPRICGVEALLYEKPPIHPPVARESRKAIPVTRLTPFSTVPILGKMDTPDTATPKVNLLSNPDYAIMVTNAGGGYSRWREMDITRWRSDTTCDAWGSFCYIKDVESGHFWSSTYHPTLIKGSQYSVSFKADKVEIHRRDNQIDTITEIVVSPEDNAEVRLMTFANLSRETRHLELTSYIELALAPHAADRAHPAFNKLFIQTEALPNQSGLLAFRRMRSPEEAQIWAAHIVASNQQPGDPLQFETDRFRFIGRGKSLQNPAALNENLSNTQGTVLDPIFSLRHRILLKPGERVQVSFITAASDNYDVIIALMKKYSELGASQRALELAWTHAQLDLRHLRIHQEEAQLFQKLASRILYPHSQLRPSVDRLLKNKLGQSQLWPYGISGDLPIIAINIADVHELDLVKQALTAHAFWRMRGLKTDLVILNEEALGYEHPLFEQIKRIIKSYPHYSEMNQPGGIFLLNTDQISEEDLLLILSVSRANLIAARGSLRQQVVSPMPLRTNLPRLLPAKSYQDFPSKPLPFMELPYFNGLGGFTSDGREYAIYLESPMTTPLPWSNVIANPQFGTLVSESGQGCTWFGNSQTNRLTPWSNDPLLDPVSEAIYIRDDKLGTFWSPTPSPVREMDPYRVRHGQGYTLFEHNSHGIDQELLIFVPVDDKGGVPIKIQQLRLINSSPQRRTLSIYAYSELVLGTVKEETQMHVITEWDPESQALFAFNRYNPDFGCDLAFVCSNVNIKSFTADRTEFIGRNKTLSKPDALTRKRLSGIAGVALDPCAALQVQVEIDPGEQVEISFALGYAPNIAEARGIIAKFRDHSWRGQAYSSTLSWWDKLLGKVQVNIPDLAINFALNRWLLYQNLSCRIWGRTAFYQSSGAYGFRDQLQDVMAVVYTAPHITREQILRAASRQFVEGDVQHWWHPPTGGGVRTRISDDLLWLPFVTAHYVRATQDVSILKEIIPFLKGDLLKEDQHEVYFIPEVSTETATLLEHCRRAIHKGLTTGPHGLPLIGSGDWNDGMNRVGIHGKGESVWLAWFLITVMNDFGDLLGTCGEPEACSGYKAQAMNLSGIVENTAWDGKWYRRAYFDDGTPLGSTENIEDTIDSMAQSWAVISGAGETARINSAMNSVEELLVKPTDGMVLLFTPPFDKLSLDPGYIKGYPPGVRENGGQYTHGSLWVPMAFARKGEGDKAVNILRMMHPITRVHTLEDVHRYKVEPYVLAGDVYALAGQVGRGGWSWYTGSTGWMYRIWLEEIFGFTLRGDVLTLNPTLLSAWDRIQLAYRHKNDTLYEIAIENPQHLCRGKTKITVDGQLLSGKEIKLSADGATHTILCELSD